MSSRQYRLHHQMVNADGLMSVCCQRWDDFGFLPIFGAGSLQSYSRPCLLIVLSISCRVHTTRLVIFLLLFLVFLCMKEWINSGETQIYHQWDLNEAIDTDHCRIAMERFSQTK
eukprot:224332_1